MKLSRNHINTDRPTCYEYVTIYFMAIYANISKLHYKTLKISYAYSEQVRTLGINIRRRIYLSTVTNTRKIPPK